MVNIAIFVSGNGTNCENIIRYFQESNIVRTALVVSNREDAYAIARAQRLKVPTVVLNKKQFNNPDVILPILQKYCIEFIVLAGFLLIVPEFIIEKYNRKIINLHPALLPKYGGIGMYGHHVHEAVKKAGEKQTGMTVHYVSPECDAGEIIAQFAVDIDDSDSPDDIARKENQLEMNFFPAIIKDVIVKTFNL